MKRPRLWRLRGLGLELRFGTKKGGAWGAQAHDSPMRTGAGAALAALAWAGAGTGELAMACHARHPDKARDLSLSISADGGARWHSGLLVWPAPGGHPALVPRPRCARALAPQA